MELKRVPRILARIDKILPYYLDELNVSFNLVIYILSDPLTKNTFFLVLFTITLIKIVNNEQPRSLFHRGICNEFTQRFPRSRHVLTAISTSM